MFANWVLTIFIASNLVIAGSYVALGVWVVPNFRVIGAKSRNMAHLVRFSMLVFFAMCAVTHIEQIIHVMIEHNARNFLLSSHMVLSHFIQAIAAPTAAFLTWKTLRIDIGYRGPLDDMFKREPIPD